MADGPVMRWDRQSLMAFGGIAALAVGAAMLLADASAVFAPVTGMVGGIAAMALANHERLTRRIAPLEKRLAQAEWRGGVNRAGSHNLPLTPFAHRPLEERERLFINSLFVAIPQVAISRSISSCLSDDISIWTLTLPPSAILHPLTYFK